MGKYSEILGVGTITISGKEFRVDPDMVDCEGFAIAINKANKDKDEVAAMKKCCDIAHKMICDQENHTDEDKKELMKVLYRNQLEVMEGLQVLFKHVTKEEQEERKATAKKMMTDPEMIKKLMGDQ